MSAPTTPAISTNTSSSSGGKCLVRVVARIRPALDFELQRGDAVAAYPAGNHTVRLISMSTQNRSVPSSSSAAAGNNNIETSSFSFDHVFGSSTSQSELYETADISSCCEAALVGKGVAVIATGISSSGKSHTVSGPPATTSLLWSNLDTSIVTEQFEQYLADGGLLFSPSRRRDDGNNAAGRSLSNNCDPIFRAAFDSLGLQFRAGVYLVRRVAELCRGFGAYGDEQQRPQQQMIKLKCCMYEIYNEQVFDLLNPTEMVQQQQQQPVSGGAGGGKPLGAASSSSAQRKSLKVRMNPAGTFFVEGLMVVELTSIEDLFAVLAEGDSNRARSSVSDSTRSHVVFSLGVENFAVSPMTSGKVSFVDLAGSERAESASLYHRQQQQQQQQHHASLADPLLAPPGRLSVKPGAFADQQNVATPREHHEARSINKSLLVLGKVISALAANSHHSSSSSSSINQQHVPIRDSVLTMLLADCFVGNSQNLILLIACITPTSRFLSETQHTLSYATMARSITAFRQANTAATARIAAGGSGAAMREVLQLKRENEWLRKENAELRSCLNASTEEKQAAQLKLDQMKAEFEQQQQQQLQQQQYLMMKQGGGNNGGAGGGLFSSAARDSIAVPLESTSSIIIAPPTAGENDVEVSGDPQQEGHHHDHHLDPQDRSVAESEYLRGWDDAHAAILRNQAKREHHRASHEQEGDASSFCEGTVAVAEKFEEGEAKSSKSNSRIEGETHPTAAAAPVDENTAVLRSEVAELRKMVLDLNSRLLTDPPQQRQHPQEEPVGVEEKLDEEKKQQPAPARFSLFGGGGGGGVASTSRPSSGSAKPLSLGTLVDEQE